MCSAAYRVLMLKSIQAPQNQCQDRIIGPSKITAPAAKQRQLCADASETEVLFTGISRSLSSPPLPEFSDAALGLWIFFVFLSCGCQHGSVESSMYQ
ncbi:hypothetical protein STEG23_006719, partial [Scotinomys teguina]